MRRLRPIDGLVYASAVLILVLIAYGAREQADAPPAPPPVPNEDKTPIDPTSPFAATPVTPVEPGAETGAGTAFSVDPRGVWLTARQVVARCRHPAIVIAPGQGVAAQVKAVNRDVAVLTTQGGAPALSLASDTVPVIGRIAFHPGYPQGGPGEVASRFLGVAAGRWIWAEVGRTQGESGSLAGLSGAPVLNAAGQVVGVTLAEAPRRGRVYSTTAAGVREALAAAGVKPAITGARPFTLDDYGQAADVLRRALTVTQAMCLGG